ncbi:HNH endonuclease, partial [Modestobacter muralis]
APLGAVGGHSRPSPTTTPDDPDGRPTAGTGRAQSAGLPTDEDAASVDGAPITHQQLRDLLEELDSLCPGGLQAPTGGSLGISLVDPLTGALRATVSRPELQRLVRRGCTDHPGGRCGCPAVDRPPPVDRYTPTPAQRRFLHARDRTCRHPGCRRPAARTDLDHVHAHGDGGPTDCANLCCLCRRHHRLKTHAPGWRFTMTADGVLSVTTPSGVTRTTRPPGLRLTIGQQWPPSRQLVASGARADPPPF